MGWKPKDSAFPAEDLFLVTSCTSPGSWEASAQTPATHHPEQRRQELEDTFQSIRRHYPSAFIVNLENSRGREENPRVGQTSPDLRRDFTMDAAVRLAQEFPNKGIPQVVTLLKFLAEEGAGIRAKRIHFLTGRYRLKQANPVPPPHPGGYFRFYPKLGVVSTRYFFYQATGIEEIRNSLFRTLRPMVFGRSLEDVVHVSSRIPFRPLEYIGVIGRINGIEPIDE